MIIKKNFSLKRFTTMAMGGPARYFVTVKSESELLDALKLAKQKRLPWYMVGEGSNLIASDKGFAGVIIQNRIQKFNIYPLSISPLSRGRKSGGRPGEGKGRGRIIVCAGNNLLETIFSLNRLGLAGLERMAGIPGTVGGAIYGCAGAYGQEIKDHLVKVRIWDGKKFRNLTRNQCRFGYRTSEFKKHKNWIIVGAAFKFRAGESLKLSKTSRGIIKLREKKYHPGLKCPGSFFKNIKISDIRPAVLRQKFVKNIPSDRIMYGKVPAGYLLEQVRAKGMRRGKIRVASHHANLIYNPNGGKAMDVKKLAGKLKKSVRKKFGITIEEEIQYLGF